MGATLPAKYFSLKNFHIHSANSTTYMYASWAAWPTCRMETQLAVRVKWPELSQGNGVMLRVRDGRSTTGIENEHNCHLSRVLSLLCRKLQTQYRNYTLGTSILIYRHFLWLYGHSFWHFFDSSRSSQGHDGGFII